MKSTILFSLVLGLAGALGLTSASAVPTSDGADKPTTVEKQRKKKPVLDPGTNDSGSTEQVVNCWCDGGADGNGPAACAAADCDHADTCCEKAYGKGAEASDQ